MRLDVSGKGRGKMRKAQENFWHEIFMCMRTQRARREINESSSSFFATTRFWLKFLKEYGEGSGKEKSARRA
jgi:hypothetical protein